MTSQATLCRIERHLQNLNARQERMGLAAIEDADLTWQQRRTEILLRLDHLLTDDQPNVDLLDTAAAHLVALIVAAERAEDTQTDKGVAA